MGASVPVVSTTVTPVCLTGETGALCGAGVGLVQDPPAADAELVEDGLVLVCVDVGPFDVDGGVSDSGKSVPSGRSSVSGASPSGMTGGIGSSTGIGTTIGITTRFLLTDAWL